MLFAQDVITTGLINSRTRTCVRIAGRNVLVVSLVASVIACAPPRKVADDPLHQPEVALPEVAQVSPVLMIKKDIDLVRLEGVLGSSKQVAQAASQTAEMFGAEMMINDLKVDSSLGDVRWLDAVLQTAEILRDIEGFSLQADRHLITVGGSVESQATADQIVQQASGIAGQSLPVSSTLSFPVDTIADDIVAAADAEAAAPLDGISVAVLPLAVLEQQAVAIQQENTQYVPTVSVARLASIKRSDSAELVADADGDGIDDMIDGCDSRDGYPVDERGCPALDGYLKEVRFDGESARLTDPAKDSLNIVAFTMQEYPASKIAVLSYSEEGSPNLMRTQARKRAESIVEYLVGQGVDQSRLKSFALAHRRGAADRVLIKELE